MPRVLYGIWCSHVHSESGGKVTLVGVYGDRCVIHSRPPAQIELGLHFFIAEAAELYGRPARVELQLPGSEPFTYEWELKGGERNRSANVNLNFPGAPLGEAGRATARLVIEGEPGLDHVIALDIEFDTA